MNEPKTLRDAIEYFSDAENCRTFMVTVLWPDGVVRCPRCGSDSVAYLDNAKLYFCRQKHPRQKFSLKVGTIFEDSPIKLEKWLPAFWLLVNCKNGISSYELARAVGVTQKSGWFMLHRIREAMKDGSVMKMGGDEGGPVEVDETFVGGRVKNMHVSKRPKGTGFTGKPTGHSAKAIVMGMLDRDTRKVRARVIPDVKRETLQNEILNCIEKKSTVYTDKWGGYKSLEEKEFVHETVNHIEEYVRGQVHTNGIENFWSLLKRSLRGTYVAVEPFHLDAYVDEQAFRFNNRATKDNPLTDADRFALAMSRVSGKRLTYAELTGKDQERPF
jgi:transposase-like protein